MSETASHVQTDPCLHGSLSACDERTDMSMEGRSPECEWLQHDGSAEHGDMRVSEENKKTVAVKLCGHCSPRRDMMELAEELKGSAEELTYTYYSRCPEADILLILNACEAACAERPDFPGLVVTVTPETVDHWTVRIEDMASVVLKKLKDSKEFS